VAACELFSQIEVLLTADKMIVDTGDIISCGGATAFLTLYLVERFGGHQRANLAAKVLVADGHRSSQLPYVAFGAPGIPMAISSSTASNSTSRPGWTSSFGPASWPSTSR